MCKRLHTNLDKQETEKQKKEDCITAIPFLIIALNKT